MMSGTNH